MMPPPELLAIAMVIAVCVLLFAGYPVALTLGGVSLAIAALASGLDLMAFNLLFALPARVFGVMTNTVLLAIPLFIFMGVMLERSRVAEDLLETMGQLFGSLPGGLGGIVLPLMIFHQLQLMVCAVIARRFAQNADNVST